MTYAAPISTPLSGTLVVAIEQAVSAPICTLRLADAGARVIKVERPIGETARHYDKAVRGVSAYFAWLNRGKQSAVLDLKEPADLAIVREMISRCDIFVQNLAPGAAAKLGLGSRDLTTKYPKLIAVDIVGYGQETAFSDMRAYDMLIQAESGLCSVTGTVSEPVKVGVSVSDIAAGLSAHAAILEALIARERSGHGQAIEISMFDAMADWMSVPFLHQLYGNQKTARHGLSHASIYPYGRYACCDGEIVVAVQSPDEWDRFCCGFLKRPDLAADGRFANNAARVANRELLDKAIVPIFAEHECASAIKELQANRIAWARVSTVEDLVKHPALRTVEVSVDTGGEFRVPRPAGWRTFKPGPIPSVGAHTAIIREEFASDIPTT